jgi:hypothetical protein
MNPRLLALGLLALSLQGQTWQRQVLPARPGPQRLEVDLALLGATRAGLADLRLRDGAGREVPYVLVPPAPKPAAWVPARLLPLVPTRTTSGFELELGAPLRTSRLRLDGLRAPFLKRFRLEGSGDRQRWTELIQAGSLFDLPEDGLRLLEVEFPQGDYRYLRLTWDDRASAPQAPPLRASLLKAESAPVPARTPVPFRRLAAEPGVSRFTLALPGPRVPVRAVQLAVAGEGPLLRDAQVSEARLSAANLAPRLLGSARLRRTQREGGSASDLRIPLERPEGTELELKVLDGDNPPLELAAVQVELEPQPWIYFESGDGAPLTARCGDPRAAAPRYDLEALRDRLQAGTAGPAASAAAMAAWGPGVAEAPAPAPGETAGVGPGAPLGADGFRFKRALPAGTPGLAALALDAHVLAASPRLQDLRLLDQAGRQIPYLLESRDEPLGLDLVWPPGNLRDRASTYRVALPQAGLPASRLVLETASRVFRRRVQALAGDPPAVCSEADWIHADPATPAPALVLPLPPLPAAEVQVVVEEGDNPPLPVGPARLLLPAWRLRFFRPAEGFRLCYGQDLPAPAYDLALLAGRLRDAPAQELALPAETAPPPVRGGPGGTRIFWGALVAAVAGLLLLLAKLLRPPPSKT